MRQKYWAETKQAERHKCGAPESLVTFQYAALAPLWSISKVTKIIHSASNQNPKGFNFWNSNTYNKVVLLLRVFFFRWTKNIAIKRPNLVVFVWLFCALSNCSYYKSISLQSPAVKVHSVYMHMHGLALERLLSPSYLVTWQKRLYVVKKDCAAHLKIYCSRSLGTRGWGPEKLQRVQMPMLRISLTETWLWGGRSK